MKRIYETAIMRIAPRGRKDPFTSGWDSLINCLGTLRRSFPRQLFIEPWLVAGGDVGAEERSVRSPFQIRLIRFPAFAEYRSKAMLTGRRQ